MAGFVDGTDPEQMALFPARFDDYVTDDNPVRAVDVFVDTLDLDKLGFIRVQPLDLGRPGYDPRMMLKLYIYRYLNRVLSSRRLKRIGESIARYISQLETADRRGDAIPVAKVSHLKDKIEKLQGEIVRLIAINTLDEPLHHPPRRESITQLYHARKAAF